MPTYEYACPKCGHHFELFQTMSSAPLKKCPECKKAGVKRLIGAGAGLIFKGTGFYITDYKKTTPPKEGGDGKSGEAKPGAGESKPAEKSGESKPAASEGKSPQKEGKAAPPAPKAESKQKT